MHNMHLASKTKHYGYVKQELALTSQIVVTMSCLARETTQNKIWYFIPKLCSPHTFMLLQTASIA